MRKIRIALFTGNYNHIRDGVSLTLNRLTAFLLEKGHEVLVFGPTIATPALEHAGELVSVPSVWIPGRPEYRMSLTLPEAEKQRLEDFKPDIVHIATPDILGYKALRWALRNDVKVVASYHTHFSSYLKYYKAGFLEPLLWKYLAWFYSKCEKVFVPSSSMIEVLQEKKIPADFTIWARGIETDLFHPSRRSEKWREEHGFGPDDLVISYVSRLVWEKNPALYAEVLGKLMSRFKNVKALVVGDGPAKKGLEEMLPEAVFTGFLSGEDLATSYASADLFFFPSDTETFGNVTLEAMASGLPCVVADATGSKSLVEHGINGFIAPADRPGLFEQHLTHLIEDKETRSRMSHESVKKAQGFAWETINNRLLEDYNELINHGRK